MATNPAAYLTEIELALVVNQSIVQYEVVRSWTNADDGYIRVRATLANGDFLETTEYFVMEQERVEIVDYRHQWMDASRTILRRRYDCTPHHPEVEGFPHHVHVGSEDHVVAGRKLGVIDLLQLLDQELSLRHGFDRT